MHGTIAEALGLIDALLPLALRFPSDVEVVVAPPFTALQAVSNRLRNQDRIALGAQTMHWEDQGPFTGEISPLMLKELGVRYVILGHSERRALCGETDELVNKKSHAALRHEMTPIVAVGETLDEKNAGQTQRKVISQTRAALHGMTNDQLERVVLAYEPIWAIGTGRNDDPQNANATMEQIRASVGGLQEAPILYGGSVKANNMASYARMPNINGALVGGASLAADSFAAIVHAATAER